MRYVIEDKLRSNLMDANMTTIAIEERFIWVGKVRPVSFTTPKEEKEVTNPQTQALLRRMGNEIT